MIIYIFFGIFVSVLLIYILSKFFSLEYQKFKKYFKFLLFLIFLIFAFLLVRINPNFLSLIPGFVIFFIKWRPVLNMIKNLFLLRNKNHTYQKGLMSKDQAYEVLGLNKGASEKEIMQAYHTLMKKNHPDLGGSDWITSQLNKAKETLLG